MSLSFLTFQPLIPNHNSYDRLSNQTLHETGARDDVQPRCDATRRAAAPPPLDSAMPGPMQGIGTGLLHASPETVDSEAGRPHLPLPRSSLTRHGLLGSRRFHRFYMIDKIRNPPLVFFVAVRTHKNQDKPLALDASLLRAIDVADVWKSLSKLRDFQPSTSSPYRVLHQPQGDKQKINIFS